jgi:transcriptional regulator with PAS, ATPase and Fis domain
MRFDWPGNVRELENEMERAMAMAGKGKVILGEFLSDKIRGTRCNGPEDDDAAAPSSGSLKDATHRMETQMIRSALVACSGNRSKAAKSLGISRQGLLNKIDALNIPLE